MQKPDRILSGAAVSALIITTVNSLEKFTDDKFDVQEKDGFVSIHFRNDLSERGMLLMDSYFSV